MVKRGNFIVFEGLDGSGKTTQILNLKTWLLKHDVLCKDEKEPSDGIVGRMARSTVKGEVYLQPESLALLFAADRYEHIVTDIIPELNRGVSVLCDRFMFSNLAYQSSALPMEKIIEYNSITIDKLLPDLTIFIDSDPEICYQRLKETRTHLELFDDIEKLKAIRKNYMKSFELLKDRVKIEIIDGNRDKNIVFDNILNVVKPLFQINWKREVRGLYN